ncbi:hypothetical protein Tco_0725915 [Tanacetum coccineum]|uniref:Uncharacterized protein n=1 Tax=Tanacetum coccineum TaxID=301880 RepID=A0ABQ4YE73_9ASTR
MMTKRGSEREGGDVSLYDVFFETLWREDVEMLGGERREMRRKDVCFLRGEGGGGFVLWIERGALTREMLAMDVDNEYVNVMRLERNWESLRDDGVEISRGGGKEREDCGNVGIFELRGEM